MLFVVVPSSFHGSGQQICRWFKRWLFVGHFDSKQRDQRILALSIDILHSPGWFSFAARTFTWVEAISRISDSMQAKKSCIPCLNFGESRFSGSSQIPNPVKIFCVFPNPAPYFGQIPDPENTLPDPEHEVRFESCFKETALKDVETSIKLSLYFTVSSVVLRLWFLYHFLQISQFLPDSSPVSSMVDA